MKLPFGSAGLARRRVSGAAAACDFHTASSWGFEPLDTDVFPAVELARQAGASQWLHDRGLQCGEREGSGSGVLAGRIGFSRPSSGIADVLPLPTNGPVEPATG